MNGFSLDIRILKNTSDTCIYSRDNSLSINAGNVSRNEMSIYVHHFFLPPEDILTKILNLTAQASFLTIL